VREYWAPLFERYGVQIAFENHDHVYKRTVPLRSGAPHADGVVYIGDGSWGMASDTECRGWASWGDLAVMGDHCGAADGRAQAERSAEISAREDASRAAAVRRCSGHRARAHLATIR
jgi:hypothetical protein